MDSRLPPLRPLTTFRCYAALAVFLAHLAAFGFPGLVSPGATRRLHFAAMAAMSFFFILSGFVLAYNYADWFCRPDWRRCWNYLVLRFARIYPVHLVCLALALTASGAWAVAVAHPGVLLRALLPQLTLTQSFSNDPAVFGGFNSVAWSLSDEWFFYLTLPVLLWLLTRPAVTAGHRRRMVIAICVAAPALAWMVRHWEYGQWFCYNFPPVRWLEFAAGVCCGLNWSQAARGRAETIPTARATAVEFLALAALVTLLPLQNNLRLPATVETFGFVTPAALVVVVVFARQAGHLSRWLSGRAGQFLGEASFALYMVHGLALGYYLRADWLAPARAWPRGAQVAVVTALTMAAAVGCYLIVEAPLRKVLARRLQLRKPAAPVTIFEARRAA